MEAASKPHEKEDKSRPVYVSRDWHRKLRKIAAERDVRIGVLIEEAIEKAFGPVVPKPAKRK